MKPDRKSEGLNPPQFIRREVFGMTQQVYAGRLGVQQSTVSKWERAGEFTSVDAMHRIRSLAQELKVRFLEKWLFEVPARHAKKTAE